MTLEDRLERLSNRTPPGDPAEVLAAARHRAEGGRNPAQPIGRRLLAAAAAVLAVVALGAGALALAVDNGDTVTVADGGERPDALDDFAPFEMTYETQSYQGGPLVPSTWRLTYGSWTGWELVLVEAGPGLAEEPGFRRVLGDGTLTEYKADGTVLSEERVDGPLAPLALMNNGPRTGPNDDNASAYRHEYRSQQDHQCPDNPANGAPWCDEPGEVVEVELLEVFNEDGVPVYVSEHVPGTDATVVLLNVLSYERTGSARAGGGNSADERGGVDGPVLYAPQSRADGTDGALVGGRLVLDSGCLFAESGGEGAYPLRYLLLWPNGTYWDEDTEEVVVAGGVRVPLGAHVSAGGGYLTVDGLGTAGQHPDVVARARECTAGSGSTEVAYVQGEVTLTRPAPDRLSVPESGASAQQLSDGTPVWVVRHDDGTASVVDAVSTHKPHGAGTLVAWCESSRGFIDPMYASTYDEHGRKQGGPAPRGLDRYPIFGVDDNTVTVPGPPVEQPRREEGGPVASEPAGPHCFDTAGHIPGVIEGWFESHPAGSTPPVEPANAMNRPDGTVVVLDAPVVIVEGRQPTVCTSPPAGSPPSCDGVPALGLFPQDDGGVVLTGTFLARVQDGALADIVYVAERSLTT